MSISCVTTPIDHLSKNLRVLAGEACQLLYDWETFNELYRIQANASLFQKTAPIFFLQLFYLFWDSFILRIARFVDPPKNRHQENLVLKTLFVGRTPPQELADLKTATKNIVLLRHKAGAHLSADAVNGHDPRPLPPIYFADVEKAVHLITKIVNMLWTEKAGGSLPLPDRSGACELLNCLQKAAVYDRMEQEGKVPCGYWNSPEHGFQT